MLAGDQRSVEGGKRGNRGRRLRAYEGEPRKAVPASKRGKGLVIIIQTFFYSDH